MFPRLSESRLKLGLAAAVWCAAPAPLVAQEQSDGRAGPVWTLEGLSPGQCVRFLVDPSIGRRGLYEKMRLLPAGQDESLHPALRSAIEGQPEFATWIPSSLCLFYSDAVSLSGRRFGGKGPRKRPMIGIWAVAATEQGSGARRDILLDFVGVGSGLSQAAANAKVKLSEAQSSVSKVPGSDNDLYEVKIGNTRLIWNGRPVGDSTQVEQPIQESWLGKGTSGTVWRIEATFKPEWSRAMVGMLSIEGKDDLAKALKASPIRFVGPVYRGGGGRLRFSR
ncbi:MAG TPA: hypothetical protein VIG04_03230 [Gemmatimonadales bacterium]